MVFLGIGFFLGILVDAFDDETKLIAQRVVSKSDANIWYVRAFDVVALYAFFFEVGAEPVLFDPRRKAAHHDTIARQFAHVHRT